MEIFENRISGDDLFINILNTILKVLGKVERPKISIFVKNLYIVQHVQKIKNLYSFKKIQCSTCTEELALIRVK